MLSVLKYISTVKDLQTHTFNEYKNIGLSSLASGLSFGLRKIVMFLCWNLKQEWGYC